MNRWVMTAALVLSAGVTLTWMTAAHKADGSPASRVARDSPRHAPASVAPSRPDGVPLVAGNHHAAMLQVQRVFSASVTGPDPFSWLEPAAPPEHASPPQPEPLVIIAAPPEPPPAALTPEVARPKSRTAPVRARLAGRISVDGDSSLWIGIDDAVVEARPGAVVAGSRRVTVVGESSVTIQGPREDSGSVVRWASSNGTVALH